MRKYEDYNPNIGSETEYNETDTLIYSDLGSQIEESRRVREINSRKEKREKVILNFVPDIYNSYINLLPVQLKVLKQNY